MSQEGLCIRKLLGLDLTKKIYITYESMKTWRRKWCSWDWAAPDGEGKSFPFRIQALNCSGKERFRPGSSPFQASSCSLQMRLRRNVVLHRLVLIMDHASPTRPQRHQKLPWGMSTRSVFLAKKGLFSSRPFRQFWRFFCRYKCNREQIKNTFHRFKSVKANRGQTFTDCTIFGHTGAILSPWQRWRRGASPPALP